MEWSGVEWSGGKGRVEEKEEEEEEEEEPGAKDTL